METLHTNWCIKIATLSPADPVLAGDCFCGQLPLAVPQKCKKICTKISPDADFPNYDGFYFGMSLYSFTQRTW